MDDNERKNLQQMYAELSDAELVEMLEIDSKEYEPGVYELLRVESHRRNFEQGSAPAVSPVKENLNSITLTKFLNPGSVDNILFIRSQLDETSIPYYIQMHDSAGFCLWVDETRINDAKEFLWDFIADQDLAYLV